MIDPLTLDQMRIFVAVAETGSFSAAARRLGRVQSAVSQAVNTLEAVLGVPLFDRAGKTPDLTRAGAILLKDARRLIDGARTMKSRAASIIDEVEPELTLAVDATFPRRSADGEPEGLARRIPAIAGLGLHRGARRRAGGAAARARHGWPSNPLRAGPTPDLTAAMTN